MIDAQHLCHLLLEVLVAAFKVVADLVGLHLVTVEDLADRALREAPQAGVARRLSVLSDVARQQPRRPKLVWVSDLLGLPAGQRHHPGAGLVGNRWLPAKPGTVVERRHHTKLHRTIEAPLHGLMGHADRRANGIGRGVSVISQEDAGALNPTSPVRPRARNCFQFDPLSRSDRKFDNPPRCCHRVRPPCLWSCTR